MDIDLPIDLSDTASSRPVIETPDVEAKGELALHDITVTVNGKQVERYQVHPHLWSVMRHQLERFIEVEPAGRVMYDGRWERG
jgi:hypothetical protein